MRTYVTTAYGEEGFEIEADHYDMWGGALIFEDEANRLIEAFAPGTWSHVRVIDAEDKS